MEKKKLLLSSAGFCIVASYTIIKPLKITLFTQRIGISYLPWATFISLISLALCSIFIAKLSKNHPIHKLAIYLIYSYSFLLCLGGLLTLLLNSAIISWIWYLSADLHTACTLNLFWQLAHEYHSPHQAQKNYNLYLAWGGIGSIVAPGIVALLHYGNVNPTQNNILTIILGTLLLFLAAYILQKIPSIPTITAQSKYSIQNLSQHSNIKIIGYLIGLSMSYHLTKQTIDLMLAKSLASSPFDTYWTLLILTSCTYATVTALLLLIRKFSYTIHSLSLRLVITPFLLGLTLFLLSQNMCTIALLIGSFFTHVLYNSIGYPARKMVFTLLDKATRPYAVLYSVYSRAIAKGVSAFLVMYGIFNPANTQYSCIALGLLLFMFSLLSWSQIHQTLQKMAHNRQ